MATGIALSDVLASFTTANETASRALPDAETVLPPKDGITLLDTKNEIFLAYLQGLALRNLNVIRSIKAGADVSATNQLSEDITKKLVEHRVYLERGVRPLEAKIKYQVDKVVKVADDAERNAVQRAHADAATKSGAKQKAGGDSDGSQDEDDEDDSSDSEADPSALRPTKANFSATAHSSTDPNSTRRTQSNRDGIYRPPRIAETAMPAPTRERKEERRPTRSATLDEYVRSELSTAPVAEPSIGSTIAAGGRGMKSSKQQVAESERREYEESNLVRLPAQSKKDKLKAAGGRDAGGKGVFGGEEWRGLDMSLDRIGDLTRRKGGKEGAFEKSKKRGRDVGDRNRDDGTGGVGGAFEIKKRRVEKRSRR
ncbi:hypothetical protein LTR62_003092 [Meristemomyces frigidus]|uniref:Uncharacterized protein n=1 Tax=Meristemomyces frigidus TaxID=1508187 RepID=A0AAN7TLN0_9PEZI|nr:hypothetical protein LTR62_003092 [Meristemomyces frigidus]